MPPTVRSPMLIRKVLSATDGKRNTRSTASRKSMLAGIAGGQSALSRASRCASSSAACRAARTAACPPVIAEFLVMHVQLIFVGRHADHRERAALAFAQYLEYRQRARARSPARNVPAIRCSRFASATCRSLPAASCANRNSRRACRRRAPFPASAFDMPPAPTSWIDRIGIVVAHLPAAVDDFLRAALHFRVAALHRIEIQICGIGAGFHAGCRAAAHADPHAGAAQLDQQAPTGKSCLCVCSAEMLPMPPAIMMGLW